MSRLKIENANANSLINETNLNLILLSCQVPLFFEVKKLIQVLNSLPFCKVKHSNNINFFTLTWFLLAVPPFIFKINLGFCHTRREESWHWWSFRFSRLAPKIFGFPLLISSYVGLASNRPPLKPPYLPYVSCLYLLNNSDMYTHQVDAFTEMSLQQFTIRTCIFEFAWHPFSANSNWPGPCITANKRDFLLFLFYYILKFLSNIFLSK